MHLPKPFFKLPRRFDPARLQKEVAAIPRDAWAAHPNSIAGNSCVRLISTDGGENDLVQGIMRETARLAHAPYIRQVLASFGVPWSRTRLLRLAPRTAVPEHADINYHWFNRVRLHVPILTRSEVRFHCDTTSVHMAAGEAWVFDNWRLHSVVNPTLEERVHLVADTVGNAPFWQLIGAGEDPTACIERVEYQPGRQPILLTERSTLQAVMNPAELELLVGNMRGELVRTVESTETRLRLARYHGLLDAFVRDWRQLYVLYGVDSSGWEHFVRLRDALRSASRSLAEGIALRVNRVAAHQVLEGRVLRVCLDETASAAGAPPKAFAHTRAAASAGRGCLTQPLFIVAAPRSGSTLLFETLASSENLSTLGGEAHWLIETVAELSPGAPGIDSNRLSAENATRPVTDHIRSQILEHLTDRRGEPVGDGRILKFLEKTPKNALRIPFFNRMFPDARFLFLWREPCASVSSIMEAWRSGRWQTYPRLAGFELPWSLLLPPGWHKMRGKSLEEIAAFQWSTTNCLILDDLAALPLERWMTIDYNGFIADPSSIVQRICRFAGTRFDAALAERVGVPLPPAKHMLTPPDPQKWKQNESAIERVIATAEPVWRRLQELSRRIDSHGAQ
jgi:sulfotransferase family protein/aspartyl/asparaginyl beta-hydroxylase